MPRDTAPVARRGTLPRQALLVAVSSQTWFGDPKHHGSIPQDQGDTYTGVHYRGSMAP